MANLISLHTRQVFLAAGDPAEFGKAYITLSGTSTQVDVYSDVGLTTQRSQPVLLDGDGVLPPCYVAAGAPLRIRITDANDVNLASYPMDNIVPELAETQDASGVAFDPTEDITATNVQDAIEQAAELFSGQDDLLARYFTLHTTAGTDNAYTIVPDPTVTAYAAGLSYMIMPDRVNTGAATLNVNSIGAVGLMKMGSAGTPQDLAAGEIQPYREFRVIYDGTRFLMSLGRDFPLRGSNANGSWTKYPDGTLVCRKAPFVLTFETSGRVVGTWTFPAAFSETTDMVVTASPVGATLATGGSVINADCTPGPEDFGTFGFGPHTTTTVVARMWRQDSTTDFQSNDEVNVSLRAEGRWF